MTLHWLKESILKNWLWSFNFSPPRGFPGIYIVFYNCLSFSDPIHAIVNEC
jgi:hypothetical protein